MNNHIHVEEAPGIVRVFDSLGVIEPGSFEQESWASRRNDAEAYAAAEAKRLGCDWGANYPG